MTHVLFSVFLMIVAFHRSAQAGPLLEVKSTLFRQNLVELYSSEGCSSCPPAEKWLGSLKYKPGLWSKFVPVEFHVDYWDNLGWSDPYARSEFTQRQKDYAGIWDNHNIYTPGVVLNGTEWGSWRKNEEDILKNGDRAGVLSVKEKSPGTFAIKFKPAAKSQGSRKYFINAALLGNGLASQVMRGENSGTRLHHEFVVLSFKKIPLSATDNDFETTVSLTPEKDKIKPSSLSAAFWITDQNQIVIQAAGGDLSD